MSTELTYEINTGSSEETENFGQLLGLRLKGGETIELISDLGGGKTTLSKGIIRGAGNLSVVSSPSFTLSKSYKTPNFNLHHFDLYRVQESGIMDVMLEELSYDPQDVVIIEWASVAHKALPSSRIKIELSKTSDSSRSIKCFYGQDFEYLFEGTHR